MIALARCRKCHKVVSTELAECPHCGTLIERTSDAPPHQPSAPERSVARSEGGRAVLLLAGGVLIVVVVVVWYMVFRSGALSGNIAVTMKSGDIKPGADVEVELVSSTVQFDSQWRNAQATFWQDWDQAHAAVENASRQRSVDRTPKEPDRSVDVMNRENEVLNFYQAQALKMIQSSQPKVSRTDVNGHFELNEVRPGDYFLFAHFKVLDVDSYWMLPVRIRPGAQVLDLSSRNAGWPFSADSD